MFKTNAVKLDRPTFYPNFLLCLVSREKRIPGSLTRYLIVGEEKDDRRVFDAGAFEHGDERVAPIELREALGHLDLKSGSESGLGSGGSQW